MINTLSQSYTELASNTLSHSQQLMLLRQLGEGGHRIWSCERAREILAETSVAYVNQILHHLVRSGWLLRLRRGLYALSQDVFQGAPIHEFELAMALVQPAAISHWSALSVHGLTEQVPREVVVLTTQGHTVPRVDGRSGLIEVGGYDFRFCRVGQVSFFGFETVWRGDSAISVTDPERTLLDGLCRPHLCGDFGVVWQAFEQRIDSMDIEKICSYAKQLGVTTAKRLGWVLDKLGVNSPLLSELAEMPIRGYRPLDASGERLGSCNSRWHIIENLPGARL